MKISYGSLAAGREYIIQYIKHKKLNNNNFSVIDVGGIALNGQDDMSGTQSWSREVADVVVDINAPDDRTDCVAMDICDHKQWSKLETVVEQRGRFDYAICTHTLEDIYNPVLVLEKLPVIAKAGVIAVPSARTELSVAENIQWLGYMHHRWIFDQQDGEMLIAPKLTWIEQRYRGRFMFKPDLEEIRYEWQDQIPFRMLMNNYLGPTASVVLAEYDRMVRNIK